VSEQIILLSQNWERDEEGQNNVRYRYLVTYTAKNGRGTGIIDRKGKGKGNA
jgi:hypothetical protein